MSRPKVVFAVAASKVQSQNWWAAYAAALADAAADPDIEVVGHVIKSQALPDHNKIHTVKMASQLLDSRRTARTDANRNAVVDEALETGGDWIYWWDDDTVHPKGTLRHLLAHHRPFVSGVYYLKQPPCNPVAYFRNEDGSYRMVDNFRRGELVEVDSVGMGCALIHMDVYRDIRAGHDVFRRDNYSLEAVPKDAHAHADPRLAKQLEKLAGKVVNGHFKVETRERLTAEQIDNHPLGWPYYALEYVRTEDHHFCEMAARSGYKPLLDTSINCEHWGERPITRESFLQFSTEARRGAAEAWS